MENENPNLYSHTVESLSSLQSHPFKGKSEDFPFCFLFPLEEGLEREVHCRVKAHMKFALGICLFLLAQGRMVIDR